jgi:hypothetical protein
LNDPFELLGADLRNKQRRKAFFRSKEEIQRNSGLLCFSRSWSNPVLWSHYAEKHRGVCLGFDVSEHLLMPVVYTRHPMKMATDVNSGLPKLSESFTSALLSTKYAGWKYEDEARVFVRLDHETAESGLYFYSFSDDLALREVILGPRCALPSKAIRELVSHFKPKVYVIKSRLAFTKFKVVTNRLASRQ